MEQTYDYDVAGYTRGVVNLLCAVAKSVVGDLFPILPKALEPFVGAAALRRSAAQGSQLILDIVEHAPSSSAMSTLVAQIGGEGSQRATQAYVAFSDLVWSARLAAEEAQVVCSNAAKSLLANAQRAAGSMAGSLVDSLKFAVVCTAGALSILTLYAIIRVVVSRRLNQRRVDLDGLTRWETTWLSVQRFLLNMPDMDSPAVAHLRDVTDLPQPLMIDRVVEGVAVTEPMDAAEHEQFYDNQDVWVSTIVNTVKSDVGFQFNPDGATQKFLKRKIRAAMDRCRHGRGLPLDFRQAIFARVYIGVVTPGTHEFDEHYMRLSQNAQMRNVAYQALLSEDRIHTIGVNAVSN